MVRSHFRLFCLLLPGTRRKKGVRTTQGAFRF